MRNDLGFMQIRRGPIALSPLHVTTPVVHVLCRVGRVGNRAPLGARSQRQHNEERGEPSMPVHRCHPMSWFATFLIMLALAVCTQRARFRTRRIRRRMCTTEALACSGQGQSELNWPVLHPYALGPPGESARMRRKRGEVIAVNLIWC
jgi:hypothetical protein